MQWQGWLFSSDLPDPDPDRTARVSGDPFHAPDGGGQWDEAPQGPGKFTPVNDQRLTSLSLIEIF